MCEKVKSKTTIFTIYNSIGHFFLLLNLILIRRFFKKIKENIQMTLQLKKGKKTTELSGRKVREEILRETLFFA